jgi:carbon monoxide dehydrogenase subunit G
LDVRFHGSTEFMAGRPEIWALLIDPTRMGPCSPVPIERVDERRFRATAKVGTGLFSAKVSVEMEIVEGVENERAVLAARGRGSGTTMRGTTSFQLRPGSRDGLTAVDWMAEVELEGMLAGPAGRIIGDQGEKVISQLLDCIRGQVERRPG